MLKVHFLNVGHGDCCIVEFVDSGRVAMIDINRSDSLDSNSVKEIYESSDAGVKDTTNWRLLYDAGFLKGSALLERAGYSIDLQDPIEYLKEKNISNLFRFISTHPHMDHLSGLNALNNEISFNNFWVIGNNYEQDEDKLSDSQKEDWGLYKKYRKAGETKVDNVTVIAPKEGSSADFYAPDGIEILAPNDDLISKGDKNANEMSYVLLITHLGKKIILAGDAEEATWDYLVKNYKAKIADVTILKAAHHGRDSGYHEAAVELMSPLVTVVSVGKKPNTDASSKYRKHCENVWSTRWKGNISFEIDNTGKLTYSTQYER